MPPNSRTSHPREDPNLHRRILSNARSRRHRLTEQEEDDELLQNDDSTQEPPFAFDDTPFYVKNGTMRDYQIQGLNWAITLYKNGINGILADEMGLGKTLQSISFLGYLKHYENNNGPHIIIVPKSTLYNWVAECAKWVPSLKTFMFHGTKDERAEMRDFVASEDFDVLITSYEMCLIEKAVLKKISWQTLMIDEAHRIKNENSSLSEIVRVFNCRNRLLITGTPLQNNLHELWALLNFLLPDIFSSVEDFNNWFNNDQNGDQDAVVQQLHKVLRPFLLRRIKSDVEKSLLPKKRVNLYVGLSSMQRKWYQKILEKDISAVNGQGNTSKKGLQNIVMQLRKCCNHPYLFDGAEPGPPYTTDQHLVDNAGKMAILDKLLERLKAQNSRVLLFSQMSRMIDICIHLLDGQTAHEDRIKGIEEFNKPDSDKFIYLLTTRAGGLGINLATADTVIMYDSDWNPQVDLQAEDRAHRIGQKKQVVIFRFITEDAIEEKVIDRATQKLRLDQLVIQQGRQHAKHGPGKDDLVSMIQHGAQTIFKSDESTVSKDNIDEILERSEKKTKELDSKYQNMGFDDLQKFTVEDQLNAYNWEGADFRDKHGAIGLNWIGPKKRERKGFDGNDMSHGIIYRQVKKQAPKIKSAQTFDFQFHPPRLAELQNKEKYELWQSVGYEPVSSDAPAGTANPDEWLLAELESIRNATPLTEAEIKERDELVEHGFNNWTKKDFNSFIKATEKYGRGSTSLIAREIEGKTAADVDAYAKVFWVRMKELSDYEKIKGQIERGEHKIRKENKVQEALTTKVSRYALPLQQLKISYGQNKGKNYTEEEDRFIAVHMQKYTYGTEDLYERIRLDIKNSPLFRFDWFIKSRNTLELTRRGNTIATLIEKELEAEQEAKRKHAGDVPKTQAKKKKTA